MEMNVKSVIRMTYEGENYHYTLDLPVGAPIEEAYQAAGNFSAQMGRMLEKHKEEQKSQERKKTSSNKDTPPKKKPKKEGK